MTLERTLHRDAYFADEIWRRERAAIFENVKNAWARNVTTVHFAHGPANIDRNAKWVTVQDANDNTVTGSSASITIAIGNNPGTSTLSGTATRTASSGVATCSCAA